MVTKPLSTSVKNKFVVVKGNADFLTLKRMRNKQMPKKSNTKSTFYECQLQGSSYLMPFVNIESLAKVIKKIVADLKGLKFDAIAFSGYSGSLTAIPTALKLKKPIIIVRKDEKKESCHSSYKVEGYVSPNYNLPIKYIIIDDFICTGETIRRIAKDIKEENPNAECIGFYSATNKIFKNKEYIQKIINKEM